MSFCCIFFLCTIYIYLQFYKVPFQRRFEKKINNEKSDILTIKEVEDLDEVIKNDKRIICVEFTAGWCGPCRKIAPEIEHLATQYKETVCIAKVASQDFLK
jgi:thiol-disulfide isomerase/thioredoxin